MRTYGIRQWSAGLLAVLLALSLLPGRGQAAALADETNAGGLEQPWTVAVYLCGSDLESRTWAATSDLLEMLCADFDDSLVNLYVMTGGSWSWDSLSDMRTEEESGGCYVRPDPEKTQIFQIVNGTPAGEPVLYQPWSDEEVPHYLRNHMELRETWTRDSGGDEVPLNMSSGETLERFLDYVIDRSPTEHMMVILWDHGGGPLVGAEMDETYMELFAEAIDSHMPMGEIGAALAGAAEYRQEKLSEDGGTGPETFDLLGFDCCLMGNLEVAYELRDTAEYMLASEEVEWSFGWEYSWLETFNEPEKRQALLEASFRFAGEDRDYDRENLDLAVPVTDPAFPVETGKLIINRYPHQNLFYDSHGWAEPAVEKRLLTLALYDMTGTGESDPVKRLGDAVDEMGAALNALKAKFAESPAVVSLIRETEEVLEMGGNTGLLDLYTLSERFAEVCGRYGEDPEARALKTAAEAVCALVGGNDGSARLYRPEQGVILYRGATGEYRNGAGMSAFYPTSKTLVDERRRTAYLDTLDFTRAYPGYGDALQRIGSGTQTDFHASIALSYDEYHHWFFAEILPDEGTEADKELMKLVSLESTLYYRLPEEEGSDPEDFTYTLGTLPVDKKWTANEFYSRFNGSWPTVDGQLFTVYQKDLEYNCVVPVFVPYEPMPQYNDLIHLYVHMEDVSGTGGRFVVNRAVVVGSDEFNTGRSFVPEAGYTFRTMLENETYSRCLSNEETTLQYDPEKNQVYFDFSFDAVPAGSYACQFSGYDLSWNLRTSELLEVELSGFDWSRVTVDPIPDQPYTGRPVTPSPTVRLDGEPLGEDYELLCEYWDNVQPGAATVQITLTGLENGLKGMLWQFFTVREPPARRSGGGSGGGGSAAGPNVITKTAVENGSFTTSADRAKPGDKVIVTVKPDEGFLVSSVAVKDANGDPVAATDNGDGTWSFTMPNSSVIVTPTFLKEGEQPVWGTCPKDGSCSISGFTDAQPAAWYHDGVHWALEEGIMNGVGGELFAPNDSATRAMAVTMLWRMEGEKTGKAAPFTDVKAGSWYEQAVNWAAETGVVKGISGLEFAPDASVTREQLAAILYRCAQVRNWDVSVGEDANLISYSDASSISSWAVEAMQWACGAGIINGRTTDTIAPAGSATRAEIATMFMRFSESLNG